MYPVSSSPPPENKQQAVTVHDGCGDALVDGVRPLRSGKALNLPTSPSSLHGSEEPLVATALLPHEEWAEDGLHYHPVHCNVRGQEHNVLPLVERRFLPC